jgi:hypothetical protein
MHSLSVDEFANMCFQLNPTFGLLRLINTLFLGLRLARKNFRSNLILPVDVVFPWKSSFLYANSRLDLGKHYDR